MARSRWVVVGCCMLLCPAVCESANPFAGTWRGTATDLETVNCVNPSLAYTCATVETWTGTIDDLGAFQGTFTYSLAASTCSTPTAFKSIPFINGSFSVPASGSALIPTFTYAGNNMTSPGCALPAQFSASGEASGSVSCPSWTSSGSGQTCTGSDRLVLAGSLQSPQAFPVTVTSDITDTTASATAQFQPQAQDVGTTASVFVFMHAPSNIVSGVASSRREGLGPPSPATLMQDAIVCVLAQLDPSGHLVASSASTMTALLRDVQLSKSQSAEILSKVATPNVAGATVFVGYGPNAAAMLSSEKFQAAVAIPGQVQCTASLTSASAPQSPGVLTGLWWNPAESGWGIHFTQRGDNVFGALYTYDPAGNAKWYVAPNCTGGGSAAGSCSGTLYEVSGPAFFGASFDPGLRHTAAVGTLRMTFADANSGSLTYDLGGQSRTSVLARQSFAGSTTVPAIDYTDLWWDPQEPGWGIAVTHQGGNVFLAWYVYDASGKPVWYVASNCLVQGSSCAGPLYRTTGPAWGPSFDPAAVKASSVGNATVSFVDANHAILSYVVNGIAGTKTITRQLF